MASIRDVARAAGVGISTVSRVLAASGYVSDGARARVLAAVEALGYEPNRVAQSLRSHSSRIIGLFVSDMQNPFFGRVSRAVENVAYEHGYSVFICNTDEDPEKERRYFKAMVAEKVAGIIISPSRERAKEIVEHAASGFPMVAVDRRLDGADVDTVLLDNVEAADRLTQCFIDGGHRCLAGLFGAKSFTGRLRCRGFERALERNGLAPHRVEWAPAFEDEGFRAASTMLECRDRPDALVCSSALLATGAFRALRQAGMAIPGEIGFGVVDEPPWADLVEPGITLIRQPAALIGQTAAELLLKRIADPRRPVGEFSMKGELVVRGSSRQPRERKSGAPAR